MLLEIQIMSSLVFAFTWLVGADVLEIQKLLQSTEGRNIKKKKIKI